MRRHIVFLLGLAGASCFTMPPLTVPRSGGITASARPNSRHRSAHAPPGRSARLEVNVGRLRMADDRQTTSSRVPVWEAADAATLAEAMRVNELDHAAETSEYEQGSLFQLQEVQGQERDHSNAVGITSIPFRNGDPRGAVYRTTSALLTREECEAVIAEAETVAMQRENGWTTTRHANFPTTDLPVETLPAACPWFAGALRERVLPFVSQAFPSLVPQSEELRIFDVFIVKYDAGAGGQRELRNHRDGSLLSLNIALNEEFEEGGTWIEPLGEVVRQGQGCALTHSSSVLHGGRAITGGTRYILVGFLVSVRHIEHVRRLMDRGSALLHEGMFAGSRRVYAMAKELVEGGGLGEADSLYVDDTAPFGSVVGSALERLDRVERACRDRARILGLSYADVGCRWLARGKSDKGLTFLHMALAVLEGVGEEDHGRVLRLRSWGMLQGGDEVGARELLQRGGGGGVDLEVLREEGGVRVRELEETLNAALGECTGAFAAREGLDDRMLRGRLRGVLCERGAMLAMQEDHQGALLCFEASVLADPTDISAKKALEIARADAEESVCT